MNTDRQFLESQLRGLDAAQRSIQDMRSGIERRIRRLETQRIRRETTAQVSVELNRAGVSLLLNQLQTVPLVQTTLTTEPSVPATVSVVPTTSASIFMQLQHRRRGIQHQTALQRQNGTLVKKIKIKTNTKVLKTVELNSILPDACGICLEQHSKIDSIVCNCSHEFSNECFDKWKKVCNTAKKDVTCPTCRTKVTEMTRFRARAERKKKTPVPPPIQPVNIIEPEVVEVVV